VQISKTIFLDSAVFIEEKMVRNRQWWKSEKLWWKEKHHLQVYGIGRSDIKPLSEWENQNVERDRSNLAAGETLFWAGANCREGRVDMRRLKGDTGCTSGCIVSYCQFSNASRSVKSAKARGVPSPQEVGCSREIPLVIENFYL
jgi:hypothetical protein